MYDSAEFVAIPLLDQYVGNTVDVFPRISVKNYQVEHQADWAQPSIVQGFPLPLSVVPATLGTPVELNLPGGLRKEPENGIVAPQALFFGIRHNNLWGQVLNYHFFTLPLFRTNKKSTDWGRKARRCLRDRLF